MMGLILPPRPLRMLRVLRVLPLLAPPPRLPPRPSFPVPVLPPPEVLGLLSQSTGFCWPISASAMRLCPSTRVRENQPPRSRERKMGRRAGADAVIRARFVSMAEVTKPMFVPLGVMVMPKRPCTRSTRRTTEVMVTLEMTSQQKGFVSGESVDTYKNPSKKTNKSANLVRLGILRPTKIHTGKPRTNKSVTMLMTAVQVYRTRRSTQRPPLMERSQLKATGRHCSVMARNTATIWAILATLSQIIKRRTLSFCPKRRNRNIKTEDLTSAKIGLYKI